MRNAVYGMPVVWFHVNVRSHAFLVSHAKNMPVQQKHRQKRKNQQVCGRVNSSPKTDLQIINFKRYLNKNNILLVQPQNAYSAICQRFELQFDVEKFQQYFTLNRVSKIPPNCSVFTSCRTNRYIEQFSLAYPHRYAAARSILCRIRTYGSALVCLHAVPFYDI